jgi:hypothetical protein
MSLMNLEFVCPAVHNPSKRINTVYNLKMTKVIDKPK